MRNKAGFSVVEVLAVVVIVGIVATLGVVGYNRWKQAEVAKDTSTDSSQQAASAPEVKQTSDLDKAATTLDSTDFGDADATDLDTQGNSF